MSPRGSSPAPIARQAPDDRTGTSDGTTRDLSGAHRKVLGAGRTIKQSRTARNMSSNLLMPPRRSPGFTVETVRARLFSPVLGLVRSALMDCASVLELGCGRSRIVGLAAKRGCYTVGVDAFRPSLLAARRTDTHDELVQADALRPGMRKKSFDAVVALDVIEHLEREQGLAMIDVCAQIARRRIVLATTNGFLAQDPYEDNPLQRHLSGWTPSDFRVLGFQVYGVHGPRWLRGERAALRFRPWLFFEGFSRAWDVVCKGRPEEAFGLLATRELARPQSPPRWQSSPTN